MVIVILEYDLKIVYKLSKSHLMANALNRLPNQTKLVGVLNQTTNVHMFTL